MSAARTYSPLPPMIPAGDDFRANPCGLRNPDPRPHTYGVRVGMCAAFVTDTCRPTACRLTQKSSFFPRTVRCAKLCEKWLSYLSEAISH